MARQPLARRRARGRRAPRPTRSRGRASAPRPAVFRSRPGGQRSARARALARRRGSARNTNRGRASAQRRASMRAAAQKRAQARRAAAQKRGPQKPQGSQPLRRLKEPQKPQGSQPLRRLRGPQSKATSRPTVNPGQNMRNFVNTMPRVGEPQAPSRFQQDRNFAVPQRPIPNRDGRMAGMQNDLRAAQARAQGGGKGQGIKAPRPQSPMNKVNPQNQMNLRMAQARTDIARAQAQRASAQRSAGRPSIIGPMDPSRGTFGKGLDPRKMPQSNYMRQPMPPQQIQRGMGRGPMQRGNTGSAQAPRPLFNQQMRQPQARQPLPRRRAQPVRQQQPQARKPLARRRVIPRRT